MVAFAIPPGAGQKLGKYGGQPSRAGLENARKIRGLRDLHSLVVEPPTSKNIYASQIGS